MVDVDTGALEVDDETTSLEVDDETTSLEVDVETTSAEDEVVHEDEDELGTVEVTQIEDEVTGVEVTQIEDEETGDVDDGEVTTSVDHVALQVVKGLVPDVAISVELELVILDVTPELGKLEVVHDVEEDTTGVFEEEVQTTTLLLEVIETAEVDSEVVQEEVEEE